MAKFYYKYGTMGSGKSLELIRVCYNYIERGKNVLLLSSSLDDRYGKNIIKSRTGVEMPCISVKNDTNILSVYLEENQKKNIDFVLVDESQFLNKEQVYQLSDIVDKYDIPVMCYGLRSDSNLQPFEGSSYLLIVADEIQEVKSICWCGKKATINARISNGQIIKGGEQIQIGGNESYIALCRKHYKENKSN